MKSSMRTTHGLLETFLILQTLLQLAEKHCSSQHLCISTVKVAGEITVCTVFSVSRRKYIYIYIYMSSSAAVPQLCLSKELKFACVHRNTPSGKPIKATQSICMWYNAQFYSAFSAHTLNIFPFIRQSAAMGLSFFNVSEYTARVKLLVRLENQFYKNLKYFTRGSGLCDCYY